MAVWNDQSLQESPKSCGGHGTSGTSADDGDDWGGNLPPEIDGADMTPDPLEDYEGDEQTPMENIVIKYRKEDEEAVKKLLGVQELDKIIYRFEELTGKEGGEDEE